MEHSVIDYIMHTDDDLRKKIETTVEHKHILRKKDKFHEKFIATLTDKQKEDFDKCIELDLEELCVVVESYFKAGVKIGARFVAESMYD